MRYRINEWRRTSSIAVICCGLLGGLAGACPGATAAEPATLPLARVSLYSSGVGFYEHQAEIDGDQRVDLLFQTSEINDLLKSMLVEDLGGGTISRVTYGSREPIGRTLKSFAVDLTQPATLGDLLRQLRGEQVSVDAPNEIVGAIVGVDRRPQRWSANEFVETETLLLRTATGLRTVPLDSISETRFHNAKVNRDFQQALELLAAARAADKKTVSLHFHGQGKRQARVQYVHESPIWKTTYRLALAGDQPALLQGWAIVENTTDFDWSNIDLRLVNGRPISFIMDLYESLYVGRPVVVPELFASLHPRVYSQDLFSLDAAMGGSAGADAAGRRSRNRGSNADGGGFGGRGGGLGGGAFGGGGGTFGGRRGNAGDAEEAPTPAEKKESAAEAQQRIHQSVANMSQAGELGANYEYHIKTPVDLARQQSAMLSIVNDPIHAEHVSIYNTAVHAKHPLFGLKLRNDTKLHLMQGPIAVYDDGAYAGDARIEDLAPNGERLISYALDLGVEVAPESLSPPTNQIVSVKVARGVAHYQERHERSDVYTIKNTDSKPRNLLIERPRSTEWTLIDPMQAAEQARDVWRFAVKVAANSTEKLIVREQKTTVEEIVVRNRNDVGIKLLLQSRQVSPKVKAALKDIADRNAAIVAAEDQAARLVQKLEAIIQDQARIRENMKELDRGGELYKNYVKKLTAGETSIEKLRSDLHDARTKATEIQSAFDAYLESLDIE